MSDKTNKLEKAEKIKNKVDLLKQKRDMLNARIQKAEALEKSHERKRDTRRKILVGAYYLDQVREKGTKEAMDEIKKLMDGYLTRESDRALFDLS